MKALYRITILSIVLLAIAGCGGGGGSTSTPSEISSSVSSSSVSSSSSSSSAMITTYTIGGTVSGLSGNVVLQNNAGDDLTVSADGNFTFKSPINSGATYAATVLTQPASQNCLISNGGGTANANVINIAVTCSDIPTTLSLTIQQIKTFHFSWTPVSGATSYKLMEDVIGSAGFTQVGGDLSSGTTSYDEVVPLYLRVNARYIVSACTGSTCVDSNVVSVSGSLAKAAGYLKASNTDANDDFGTSVALSADGSTLAVGADQESSNATGINGNQADNSDSKAGAVYVFIRSGSTWSQQAYVKASNTDAADEFGASVALSADGNTLAVGAFGESSNATGINGNQADNSAASAGAVYVFTRSGSTWSQQAYVKASNTDAGDGFGGSVVLSAEGNTLVVGAEGESSNATSINGNQADNSAASAGAVYVFTRSGSTWSQQAYVKASNTDAGDVFGASVALSADGSTLVVGTFAESSNAASINGNQADNSANYAGAVYVFTRGGSTWSQQAYIKASNTEAYDFFGFSIALSADGNTLVVGAGLESSNATGINGNQANNSAASAGAVYVFTRSGSTWSQQAYVKASNTETFDQFGISVVLSADGDTLAVESFYEASNATGINGNQADNSAAHAGAVYVFTRSGSTWSQQAYVKASNTDAEDYFGYSVALSADGNTLAVGALGESSDATSVNGNQADNSAASAGAVYLY